MVSRHAMPMGVRRIFDVAMYISITRAMPETIAENRNTMGMSGVDHHGFALIDPKMNPT
jgi:hypothetical protein